MVEILHSNVVGKVIKNESSEYSIVYLKVNCAGCGDEFFVDSGMQRTDELPESTYYQQKIGEECFRSFYCKNCQQVLKQCETDDKITALLIDPKKMAAALLELEEKAEQKVFGDKNVSSEKFSPKLFFINGKYKSL